jgi:hypothetical protein
MLSSFLSSNNVNNFNVICMKSTSHADHYTPVVAKIAHIVALASKCVVIIHLWIIQIVEGLINPC